MRSKFKDENALEKPKDGQHLLENAKDEANRILQKYSDRVLVYLLPSPHRGDCPHSVTATWSSWVDGNEHPNTPPTTGRPSPTSVISMTTTSPRVPVRDGCPKSCCRSQDIEASKQFRTPSSSGLCPDETLRLPRFLACRPLRGRGNAAAALEPLEIGERAALWQEWCFSWGPDLGTRALTG